MLNMMPQIRIDELLLEWANEVGYAKGIKFELGCAPPGPAALHDVGDRWGVESFDPQTVTICRWMGTLAARKDVPSPFSLSWNTPPWTEDQKAMFINNVCDAVDALRDSGD